MSASALTPAQRARLALAELDEAARLEIAEAVLRDIFDLRLAGRLAGAAHRITAHAHALCERAFCEGRH